MRKLPVEAGQPLLRRGVLRPCAAGGILLNGFLDAVKIVQGVVGGGQGHVRAGAADAAVFAVERVDKEVRRLAVAQKRPVPLEVVEQPLFALDLADEGVAPGRCFRSVFFKEEGTCTLSKICMIWIIRWQLSI